MLSEQTPLVLDQGPRQVITPSDISNLTRESHFLKTENAFSREFKLLFVALNTIKSREMKSYMFYKASFLTETFLRQTLEALLVIPSTKKSGIRSNRS